MKILINIDDGVYPTFKIGTSPTQDVSVEVSSVKLKNWKKVLKDYDKVQKEMQDAVNYYEPVALNKN